MGVQQRTKNKSVPFSRTNIDIEHCHHCGGRYEDHRRPFDRLRTGIEHHSVIAKILTPLGLPARAPPRSPARSFVFVSSV
jgi:hypothetical protein